jgi:hypothetical protein
MLKSKVNKENFTTRWYSFKLMRGPDFMKRIKSVGMMLSVQYLGYRMEDRGTVVRFPAGVRYFHFFS